MTFRLFLFHAAAWGSCAGLAAWYLGHLVAESAGAPEAVREELYLGAALGLVLSVLDAAWSLSLRRLFAVGIRGVTGLLLGAAGGVLGGLLGRTFVEAVERPEGMLAGRALMGLVAGASVGAFDLLVTLLGRRDSGGPRRKVLLGGLGGLVGGMLGGVANLSLQNAWGEAFSDYAGGDWWFPGAAGSAALGCGVGFCAGLMQVWFRDAWLRVEAGSRPGRQVLLVRPVTTLGSARRSDVRLDGDVAVEPIHARIERRGRSFFLGDAGSAWGTFVNDSAIAVPVVLQSGDLIGVGRCRLLFLRR
jgi:hypothetical protein